ncbi:MAG: RES domain-containing protein [Luteitalea sp.]|nr:RES domain-containing protein [Luteitalea sp.]
MRAYRLGDARFPLLSGEGAALYGGRWNSPGRRVVYASCDLATAMLEYLAASNDIVAKHSVWLELTLPEAVAVERVGRADLPEWDAHPPYASRLFGDQWLARSESIALVVPSVVVPTGENIVLNPAHPGFSKISAAPPNPLRWDRRLARLLRQVLAASLPMGLWTHLWRAQVLAG